MVRFKNRYVAFEVVPAKKLKHADVKVTGTALYRAILDKVQLLHGDFGVAAIKAGFLAKYCNETTRIALVRVRHGPHRFVTSAMPFVTNVDNKPMTLRTLYTGATIKQCFRFIIKHQRERLIRDWGEMKTDEQREQFRKALSDIKLYSG